MDVDDSDEDIPSRRPKSPRKNSSAGKGGSCFLLSLIPFSRRLCVCLTLLEPTVVLTFITVVVVRRKYASIH